MRIVFIIPRINLILQNRWSGGKRGKVFEHSQSHTHSHTHSRICARTHLLSFSQTQTHIRSILSLPHKCTHTRTLTHTNAHTILISITQMLRATAAGKKLLPYHPITFPHQFDALEWHSYGLCSRIRSWCCTPTWLDAHALVNDKFYADIYIVQYLKGKLEVLYFGEDTPPRKEIEEFTTGWVWTPDLLTKRLVLLRWARINAYKTN